MKARKARGDAGEENTSRARRKSQRLIDRGNNDGYEDNNKSNKRHCSQSRNGKDTIYDNRDRGDDEEYFPPDFSGDDKDEDDVTKYQKRYLVSTEAQGGSHLARLGAPGLFRP